MVDRSDIDTTRSGGWGPATPGDPDIWSLPEYVTGADGDQSTSDRAEMVAEVVTETTPVDHGVAGDDHDANATRTHRRRWACVAVGLAAVLLVGAGASALVARSAADHEQHQVAALKDQLDQSRADLDSARVDDGGARRAVVECGALVKDSGTLVDLEARLDALYADPALRTVAPGSAHEEVLYQQIAALTGQVDHSQLEVQVDASGCTLTAN